MRVSKKDIKEMIHEELLSNTRRHTWDCDLFSESYITNVLGLSIPLQESFPYSKSFQQKIVEEQLILEGFFDDFKKLGGDTKNAALALRYIMGDSSRITQYVNIVKADLQENYKSLEEFLKGLIDGLTEIIDEVGKYEPVQKALDWASSIWEKVKKLVQGALSADGWKGAMLISGGLVAIGFIWSLFKGSAGKIIDGISKLKDFVIKESKRFSGLIVLTEADNLYSLLSEQEKKISEKIKEKISEVLSPLLEKIKEIGPGIMKGLAVDALASVLTGGVATAFSALQKVFGGAKLVFQFLGKPLEKFVGAIKNPKEETEEAEEGIDDPTEKNEGRKLKITKRQLATIIKEMHPRTTEVKESMRVTENELRMIIREQLQLEFLGMFGKAKVPRDSSGNVQIAKLPKEEQDIFIKVKMAVKKSGRTQDAFQVLKTLGHNPEDHTELVQAAMDAGKIAYSHSSM